MSVSEILLEFTPNPNTLKYVVGHTLVERGAVNFTNREEAERGSPLASRLFKISDIKGVLVGKNFVTVSKSEKGDWDAVHRKAMQVIQNYMTSGEPVLLSGAALEPNNAFDSNSVELKILNIVENEVRPAVARDGGDIEFVKYQDGIVYLRLQGACAGCPGATMTLKMGVENRLRQEVPEIVEVVSM